MDVHTKTTKQESAEGIFKLVNPHDLHSLHIFLCLSVHITLFIRDYAGRTRCLARLALKYMPFQSRSVKVPIMSCILNFSQLFVVNTDATHYTAIVDLY